MNPSDYDFISAFLQQTSGLALGTGKQYLVESRLIPLAMQLGLDNLDHLFRESRQGPRSWAGDRGHRGDDHERDILLPRQNAIRRPEGDAASRVDQSAIDAQEIADSGAPPPRAGKNRIRF